MKPVLALVRELVRRCEQCKKPLSKKKRPDAKTCGKSCRQKLARRLKVSCAVISPRRKSVPVLSAVARARAGLGTIDTPREKRVVLVGKIGGAEARIE